MKKLFALLLALSMAGALIACNSGLDDAGEDPAPSTAGEEAPAPSGAAVSLDVVTSFGGDDGNRTNYENAFRAWEEASGNTVNDMSGTSNEEWKARILADFETGSEPDVLFFFNGIDANPIIESGKVVSVDTIRAEFPDYASNMEDSKLGASPYDGVNYSIPVMGYWEGLYVNKTVLEAADVEVPNANTTWEEFLEMCQKVKDAGYTPIAVSLSQVPHYWFEFTILNNGGRATHETPPAEVGDKSYEAWVNGLNDIKDLYERGFLPANTLTATDDETMQLMADNQAAFAIDGSWKMGWFADNMENLEDVTVTYIPGTANRPATDLIGGLSMGYYITEKCWADPDKRAAAVDFITAMTTEEVIGAMAGGTAATALKTGTPAAEDPNSLQQDALAMLAGSTGVISAVQDNIPAEAKDQIMTGDIKLVAVGEKSAEDAVKAVMDMMA